ncbi:11140_t:CDS:2 [Entrophospora sp. SA101]|nr:11140_t:CDS:2 [Entrophospora sp. SA101]
MGQLSGNNRNSLLRTTIVLGAIHLTIEVRQFIWKPLKYITDFWNYFDNGAFGAWELQKNSYLTVLVVAFSFIVVVYLMNLFIGLLGNEIQHYNTKEAFLAQKAKIELFYLLPNQRHWRNWFPDILSYNAPIDDICKKIKEADDSNENGEDLPYISDKLREFTEGYKKKTENDFDSRFQQIEDKPVKVSEKNRKCY